MRTRRRNSTSGSGWSSTRTSTTRSQASPRAGTTRIAADWRPRRSPPAASPASSASSSRSASGPFALHIGGRHRPPHRARRHQVPLRRVVLADRVAGEAEAVRPGVDGDPTSRVDHRHLAFVLQRVGGGQLGERLGRTLARPHPVQPVRPVRRARVRLGGDHSDPRLPEGDEGADREPVRLDGDAVLAGVGVEGD